MKVGLLLITGAGAACNNEPAVPVSPGPTAEATSGPATKASATPATSQGEPGSPPLAGPGAKLCGDLEALVKAAHQNFSTLRKKDRPVTVAGTAGFEATYVAEGATACRVLTSEPPYPDVYECDLAHEKSDTAQAVIGRWATAVAKCPSIQGWKPIDLGEVGRAWSIETNDDHELNVSLIAADDDRSRPTLVVRRNEI